MGGYDLKGDTRCLHWIESDIEGFDEYFPGSWDRSRDAVNDFKGLANLD
jgi:hypothetical protein